MHGLGTLVRDYAFEIQHVPNRGVLRADARAAEQIALTRATTSRGLNGFTT